MFFLLFVALYLDVLNIDYFSEKSRKFRCFTSSLRAFYEVLGPKMAKFA